MNAKSNIDKEKDRVVVNHPARNNQYPIEVIDMLVGIWGLEKAADWCFMTAFKYRMRLGHKDTNELDFEKEQWYINKGVELLDRHKEYTDERIDYLDLVDMTNQEVKDKYMRYVENRKVDSK